MSYSIRTKSLLTGLCLGGALLATPAAARDYHGLLVGASFYELPGLQEHQKLRARLTGPVTDVMRMWDVLVKARGFKPENVRVVADSLPDEFAEKAGVDCKVDPNNEEKRVGPGCPNRQDILNAFDALVEKAKSGDFVYIHFSGHGIRVPTPKDERDREPDHFDEAFVPIDVAKFDFTHGAVPGLIIDDEIGERLRALRKKGAFVWFVADSCHSGGLSRGPADRGKSRKLDATLLGVPLDLIKEARETASVKTGAKSRGLDKAPAFDFLERSADEDPGQGGFVAFYAAQSTQETLELEFDEIKDGKKHWTVMGGLTRAIGTALSIYKTGTYENIAQKVIEEYNKFGSSMPIPVFEGNIKDQIFYGKPGAEAWVAKNDVGEITVDAGRLHALEEGSVIALYPRGKSGEAEALMGCAEISTVGLSQSKAVPVACKEKPALTDEQMTEPMEARLESASVNFVLSVASPVPASGSESDAEKTAREAIAAAAEIARTDRTRKLNVDWVPPATNADITLEVTGGRIWLYSKHGEKRQDGPRQSASVPVVSGDAKATAKALIDNLWRVARARNLIDVASGFSNPEANAASRILDTLKMQAYLLRDPSSEAAKAKGDKRSCPKVPVSSVPKDAVPFEFTDFPNVGHCDVIYVELVNEGENPIDVTLLYVDSEAGISSFRPGGAARVHPLKTDSDKGEKVKRVIPIQIVTWDTRAKEALSVGREQLVMIAVERDPSQKNFAIPVTFTHLAQSSMTKARGTRTRGAPGAAGAFASLLNDAGMAAATTRAARRPVAAELEAVGMKMIGWKVNAPEEATN